MSKQQTSQAILRGFPPSNTITPRHVPQPPTLNGQKPPVRYNVWLRKYYMKQFKRRLATFGKGFENGN